MIIGFYNYKDKYDFSKVSGVIHVGAHEGQEHDLYLQSFGDEIVSHWFEPNPRIFENLKAKLGDKNKTFLYECALGSEEKLDRMWEELVTNGESSSLMKPKKISEIYTNLNFVEGPEVKVKTLDSFSIKDSNVLVLDVQGFELEVLKGAEETLKNVEHVFSEVNLEEHYEGCPSLKDLNEFLIPRGFWLRENWWTDGSWGDCYWNRIYK